MTSVEVLGRIRHNEKGEVFLEVKRSYKNRKGEIEVDLLPMIHWTRASRNVFYSLDDNTLVFAKGRLEIEKEKMILIIEEYLAL